MTSPAFIKGVVLPRLGDAIHADVTVSGISFNPFRQIRAARLEGAGEWAGAGFHRAGIERSLPSLGHPPRQPSRGRNHARLADGELVENPDGSSNLDPLLKALQGKPAAASKPEPAKPSKAPQIDLRQIDIEQCEHLEIKNYGDGRRDLLELTNLNLTLTNVKNGQSAALQLVGRAAG